MNVSEHTLVGAGAGYGAACATNFIGQYANVEVSVFLMTAGAVIGALLCDIDYPESMIGSKFIVVSSFVNLLFDHRTITHSLLFMIMIGWLFSNLSLALGIGAMLGILSHIVLDMFTGKGVAYLYPFVKKRIKWFTILER